MSRSKNAGFVPSYRLHKPSGQARVIIDGEHIYLGLYGSPESHERYARLIAERVVSPNGHARRLVTAAQNANNNQRPIDGSGPRDSKPVDQCVCEFFVGFVKPAGFHRS